MKIQSLSDQLIYIPQQANGLSDFEGSPLPSQEAIDAVGEEGIEYISDKIKSIVEFRKEIHGNVDLTHYGLKPEQCFFDLKNRIVLRVTDTVQDRVHYPYSYVNNHPISDFNINVQEVRGSDLRSGSNIQVYKSIKRGIHPEFLHLSDS